MKKHFINSLQIIKLITSVKLCLTLRFVGITGV